MLQFWYPKFQSRDEIGRPFTMSDELEVEDDVFLEEGVFYCTCGGPIEAEDADSLINKQSGKEFVACPTGVRK